MKSIRSLAVAAATVMLLTTTALAHTKLVSSTPAENTSVASPDAITLVFNEALTSDFSGIDLAMLTMPGMKMTSPMAIEGITTTLSDDKKTLTATPAKPLSTGRYKVSWHAVSSDTHRMEGAFEFDVK